MNKRPFGNTGMRVSEIGLGGWQLANPDWGVRDREEALNIVRRSLEAGCNFFDTAPGYGRGLSEELLGKALKPIRQEVILCTKFGHTADGVTDFSARALRPSLETSLRRLQTDYIDILVLHNPPADLMDGRSPREGNITKDLSRGVSPRRGRRTDLYVELDKLKTEGRLRAYGVSLDWEEELKLVVETTRSAAVEVMYNVFYQGPGGAFPLAQDRGVGLIVKVPLDSGWLSGRYRRDSRFTGVRGRWPEEVIARRAALVEQFAALLPPGLSMAHAALQYILAQPQVSTVIPGAKSVDQALDNFAAADDRLDPALVQSIRMFWERELQADPLPW